MTPQVQSLTSHINIFPPFLTSQAFSSSLSNPKFSIPIKKPNPSPKSIFKSVKCSISVVSEPAHIELIQTKPFPAEVSRTIMELSSAGTLCTLTHDGWPLGLGVRFAVDGNGTPILCLNSSDAQFSMDKRSSLHVQLEQSGVRTPQCIIQGSLDKPQDKMMLKKLHSTWKKRFDEDVNEDLIHFVSVERVLQIEDFQEDGVWVSLLDYKSANPDPLRDIAGGIVNEINTNNMEDVLRFCSVYVDLHFQVSEAKMVWLDRLGFDLHIYGPENSIFEVRIPFLGEVVDEKGVKSSFNGMSQLAWEVERNYHVPDFKKVKPLKQISLQRK
ncbi:hypothetical protein Ancab_029261 [Ancistrocladus abbreviatus]